MLKTLYCLSHRRQGTVHGMWTLISYPFEAFWANYLDRMAGLTTSACLNRLWPCQQICQLSTAHLAELVVFLPRWWPLLVYLLCLTSKGWRGWVQPDLTSVQWIVDTKINFRHAPGDKHGQRPIRGQGMDLTLIKTSTKPNRQQNWPFWQHHTTPHSPTISILIVREVVHRMPPVMCITIDYYISITGGIRWTTSHTGRFPHIDCCMQSTVNAKISSKMRVLHDKSKFNMATKTRPIHRNTLQIHCHVNIWSKAKAHPFMQHTIAQKRSVYTCIGLCIYNCHAHLTYKYVNLVLN